MHMLSRFAAVGVLGAMFAAFAACGDDGGGTKTDTSNPNETPVASGTPLSDEAYLKVFCTGTVAYQDALLTKPKADDIAAVIKTYIASMEKVTPPEDLAKFHADYVQYLRDSVKDPTSLVTRAPPKPADGPRQRLAAKVTSVPECKYPTFLGEQR